MCLCLTAPFLVETKLMFPLPSRWTPAAVLVDFEKGLMNAIEAELPGAALEGCYFHLCQSLWRKIQDVELAGQ